MIKILLGGSPCTNWSIAKNNRETEPSGIGWELFKNYSTKRVNVTADSLAAGAVIGIIIYLATGAV